ncbi:MAG TPA: hypothetical protein VFX37_05145 [Pseudolabrys sp.]|nr:hypothetical protein [Pseudolabrys sp.]
MKRQFERLLRSRARKLHSAVLLPRWMRDAVESLLWVAILATGAIAVDFVQRASAAQSRLELRLAQEATFKDSERCRRQGFPAGTHEHLLCMMDTNANREEKFALFGFSMELP